VYRPILINQSEQSDESKVTNNKLDESRAEFTHILQQLVTNGDLTTTASDNIVNKLNKLVNGVLSEILNTVSKKPKAIALISTLSKYSSVVSAIKSGDITGLNSNELKIFDSLNVLDDNTLKVFVEYYSSIDPKVGDIFNSQVSLEPHPADVAAMADNKLPSPPSYDTGTFSANDLTNKNYTSTYTE